MPRTQEQYHNHSPGIPKRGRSERGGTQKHANERKREQKRAVRKRVRFRDFLKALETTTAMKRPVISRLLACNCCSLAIVVSAIFASQ